MIDLYYLYKNLPSIDLHGMNRFEAIEKVDGFIKENIVLKKQLVSVIHGKGSGILKKSLYDYLKNNKNVIAYKLDIYNDGQTIIELKI